LPDGWKLRTKGIDEKKEYTLEEVIEKERTKLTGTLTPLTKELFDDWKAKWLERMTKDKVDNLKKNLAEKKKDKKYLDPNFKFLSGRSMFVYNPNDEMDEDEGDDDDELQNLIKNRKKIDLYDDDADADIINDVELPNEEDEQGEDLDYINDVEIPDDEDL